jgi:hypothetical protein
MLSSLTPVGERARSQRWAVTVTAFTIGALAGGAATGLVGGALGTIVDVPDTVALALLAVGVAAALVGDVAGVTPPSLRRQVDRTWMTRYRGWVYGLGYGAQLGTGLVTYISSWTSWLMVVAMVLVGDLAGAVAMGLAHGLARAVSVWTTAPLDTPAAIRRHHRTVQRIDPVVAWSTRGLLAVVAVTLVLQRGLA